MISKQIRKNNAVRLLITQMSLYVIMFLLTVSWPTSVYAEYSSFETKLHWRNEVNNKSFSWNNSQIHPSCNRQSHNRQSRFSQYNSQDFRDYCVKHEYSEKEILNQRCLYMYDEFVKFAQTHSNYANIITQLHSELKKLSLCQKIYHTAKGMYCRGLQKRIKFLCEQINEYKKLPQNRDLVESNNSSRLLGQHSGNTPVIDDNIYSTFNLQVSESNRLQDVYEAYSPFLFNAIKKRNGTFSKLTDFDSAIHYGAQSHILKESIKQLLGKCGNDVAQFTQSHGNQFSHLIHQESLEILDHLDNLSANSILYDHQDALVDLTAAIVEYNHAGFIDKAMNIADLCWTLLDYGQAIAEGVALGLYTTAHDIITHPIETTVCIIARKQILSYQLCKVLYDVADIGLTAVIDYDHAREKWDNYIAPLNDLIAAIEKKEITVRDSLKAGTAFFVGYKAQSKLLGGLGKYCNVIKQKSINFVKNSSLLYPQEYLTTPEGLLLKATLQSKKIKQLKQITTSNLKSSIDSKIVKSQSIKGLLKKAGLPTKGKLRYVPPKKFHIHNGLPKTVWHDRRSGFIDRFGNIWLKGESRTKGQLHEWDVQLSKQGIQQVGWMSRDNSHLNVSLDGKVTHK